MAESEQNRRRAYLLQDPYDDDAVTFIRWMFTIFGLRSVCFYTDPKARFYGEQQYPILSGKLTEASFDADLDDLEDLVRRVTAEFDIITVIPYREDTVEVAAELLKHLDLDWNSSEILTRCRDKHAMKTSLAAADPPVRVPTSRAVKTVDDVFEHERPERFVIKPNSGMGSTNLGFFDGSDDRATIQAHLDRDPAAETQVRSTDERFEPLRVYAGAVIHALGVRGVPFHMEVKVDSCGPALIDFGARVGSEATGHLLSQLHPDRPDMYVVAARDYVGVNDCAMEPIDYQFCDSATTMLVYGISHEHGIIGSLHGIDDVETMPRFVSWPVKPAIGDPLSPMHELRDVPYIAVLRHDGDRQRTVELAEHIRRTVSWNEGITVQVRLGGKSANLAPRVRAKARWIVHRTRTRVTGS